MGFEDFDKNGYWAFAKTSLLTHPLIKKVHFTLSYRSIVATRKNIIHPPAINYIQYHWIHCPTPFVVQDSCPIPLHSLPPDFHIDLCRSSNIHGMHILYPIHLAHPDSRFACYCLASVAVSPQPRWGKTMASRRDSCSYSSHLLSRGTDGWGRFGIA